MSGRERLRDALLAFLGSFSLGLWGMAPSVSFGDSGEFAAAAATLSIPHAPGYPLFCLAARALGVLVPWAGWAYRTNLLSVLCAALASAALLDAARMAGAGRAGAALGALCLALSPLWLHTSLQTEVFALNALAAAAAAWLVCRFRGRMSARAAAALGLCVGLGGANHHTLALAVPGLLWEAWGAGPRPRAREAAAFLGAGLLGLAVYLYLPLRARAFPPLDWGHPADLGRFLHVLLRRDYGSFALTVEGAAGSRLAGLAPQAARWLASLWSGLGPAGVLAAAAGALAWLRGGPGPWRLALGVALLAGPGFLWLGNPPFDAQTSGALARFALLSWIGLFFAMAAGAGWAAARLGRAAPLLALLPAAAAAARVGDWRQRWDLAAYDYGMNVLRSLPPGSRLFIDGGDDTFYTLAYLSFAEGLRPDVDLRDRGGLVFRGLYGADFRRLPKQAKEERRLAVERASARERPTFYSTLKDERALGVPLSGHGLLKRLEGRSAADAALWAAYPLRVDPESARAHYRYRALVPVYGLMRAETLAAQGRTDEALARIALAARLGGDALWVAETAAHRAEWAGYSASTRGDWAAAERAYRLAASLAPGAASARLNLGVALERLGRPREAEDAYRAAIAVHPTGSGWFNLGSLYWERERWREAAEAFAEAARLDPGSKAAGFRDRARRRAGGAP